MSVHNSSRYGPAQLQLAMRLPVWVGVPLSRATPIALENRSNILKSCGLSDEIPPATTTGIDPIIKIRVDFMEEEAHTRYRSMMMDTVQTLDIRMLAPQILTDARKKACECIRISYIWGCLLLAYSGNLSAENKWNADATTIIVSESLSGSLVCALSDDDSTPVSSSTIPDNLNILVKWFGLNNAAGESGPLVLIFAVPSMTEATFFSTEVVCLASTSYIGEKGRIYCSKTRGGCPEMWKYYFLYVTIPTIERSNALHLNKKTIFN